MGNYQTAVKNLTKKGADANPNGRPPKGYSITEMMKEMLGTKPEVKQALGNVIITKALEGDITAIKTVWQYMDGMPKQTMEHEGGLDIRVTNYDDV